MTERISTQGRVEWIETTLRAAFGPSHLVVHDDSARHRGHAGAKGGAGHYQVLIVADAFRDRELLARHQAVYAALGSLAERGIHALALRTLTPEEWERTEA